MADKIKVSAPQKGGKIEIVGLDEVIFHALEQGDMLSLYDRFAEDVLLSCAMPEVPRYAIEDERREDTKMADAYDALQRLLVRYRKMTAWLRRNGIDVESVLGGPDKEKTKS